MVWLILFTVLTVLYLLWRYAADFILKLAYKHLITRYLHCKSLKIDGCGFFSVDYMKADYGNGINIELHQLRLGSNLLNQDYTKPIFFSVDDIRVVFEVQNQDEPDGNIASQNKSSSRSQSPTLFANSNQNNRTNGSNRLNLIQYVGVKVNTANAYLYGVVPNSLLIIMLKEITFETYYIKKGLQLDIFARSIQTKIYSRNSAIRQIQPEPLHLELSASFLLSIDNPNANTVNSIPNQFQIKKVEISLRNPSISISEDIFKHIVANLIGHVKPDNEKAMDKAKMSPDDPLPLYLAFQKLAKFVPIFKLEIDQLTFNFPGEIKSETSPLTLNVVCTNLLVAPVRTLTNTEEPYEIEANLGSLSAFFVAKNSIFAAVQVQKWHMHMEIQQGNAIVPSTIVFGQSLDNIQIRRGKVGDIRGKNPVEFWQRITNEAVDDIKDEDKCCCIDKLLIRVAQQFPSPVWRIFIEPSSPIEFNWSVPLHLIFAEILNHFLMPFISRRKKQNTSDSKSFIVELSTEHSITLSFYLKPKCQFRLITPSLYLNNREKQSLNVTTPNLLLEMDDHIIMNVENPKLNIYPNGTCFEMNDRRQQFSQLFKQKTNRVWLWYADELQVIFPYGYSFAETFEEFVNCLKWVKMLHGISSSPFNEGGKLPADFKVYIKKFSVKMDDDPFEIRLQNIFEVQMDEFEEKELRRLLLDGKIEQIRLKNPLLSDSKINSIYKSLNKKDSEIYIDRIQQTIQDQKERALFKWSVEGFEVCSFADASLHGEKNVVGLIQEINPKSPYPIDPVKYSTLWARGIQFSVNESTMNFRDYPLPYLLAQNTHIAGKLIGAGAYHGGRTVRDTSISAPEPWGTFTINRNMNPLKFYYDLGCEFEKLKINYGPCWEPCLSMISQCWNLINAPSKDPSEPLPFWDKIRLLLHGRFSMRGKRNYPNARIVTAMLASTDPYDKTEKLKVVWDNFIFDWRTGEFLIKSNINAYIKTASKYDDSRLISLPNVESNIRLDWNCLGNQHDHHSITPCAPGKLPYSTNSVSSIKISSTVKQRNSVIRHVFWRRAGIKIWNKLGIME